jgi:hypothetical protein
MSILANQMFKPFVPREYIWMMAPSPGFMRRVASWSEKGVRLAQKMRVGPCIPAGIQLEKAGVGPTSGPTWRLSQCRSDVLIFSIMNGGYMVELKASLGLFLTWEYSFGSQ